MLCAVLPAVSSWKVSDTGPIRRRCRGGKPVGLERLFENLVGNAIKYRDPDRELAIRMWSERDGNTLIVSVADNGIGIAPEFHDRIFEIFRRLHGDLEIEGRGLGLALCSKIIEHHGGTIWVDSTEGIGSTFSFTLKA